METELRVLSLQARGWGAPASEDIAGNVRTLAAWTDRQIDEHPADLVVLPELSTTPYFCCRRDDRYFEWAESIPGPTTEAFAEVAARHRTTIVVPLFERASDGRFHNAAAVIGPDGALIAGDAFGEPVTHYRKCHIPAVDNPPDTQAWESYFFAPGGALPIFQTPKARIGVLICFDRWFPEAWRMLTFGGAEVVVVPMVAWGFVEKPYLAMLNSRAVENALFVVSCNRSEFEELDGMGMDNFGRSVVLSPYGETIAEAPEHAGEIAVHATLDLAEVARQRELLPLLRFRRADLYGSPESWRPVASSEPQQKGP
jgi:N-carbamoylputrescine amidase